MESTAAQLAARLDRLPMARHIWYLVTLISLGGCFELYDLFLTAYIAPGLNKAGYFTPESLGVFNILGPLGVAGIGTFVFALFAGLFVGAICLGHVADQYGRRTVFTFSLIWYSITTAIMAFQTSGFAVDLWRFIAGIGIGVELVTIDTYVAELVPRTHRGRAFAYNQFFQFLAVPIVAFLAYLLVPIAPLGFDGWRWVVLIGSAGAIVIWFIRLGLPESPRWLARHGRIAEAEAVTAAIEAKVAADIGTLPQPGPPVMQDEGDGRLRRDLAAAIRQAGDHPVGVQLLPDLRLLRVCRLGADAADRQGHHHHHQPALFVRHRHRQPGRPAARHADRRQDGAEMAGLLAAPSASACSACCSPTPPIR